jgi:hypothetical protein
MPRLRKAKSTSTANRGSAHDAKVERMVRTIRDYYALGCKAELRTEGTSIKEFAEEHGIGEMTMRQARAFARSYNTKDLDRLCSLRRPNGLPLQWGYIPYLLTVKDRQARADLQRRAARESWSAPELYAEIRLRWAKREPKSDAGRPVKTPKSPTKCLLQIVADGKPWIHRCQQIEKALGTMRRRPRQDLAHEATKVLLELARHAGALAKQIGKWV